VTGTKPQIAWPAVRRWNEIDAEIRIAFFRLVAIFLLYGIHLWTYAAATQSARSEAYHETVTLVAILCALTSMCALLSVRGRWFPTWIAHCFLMLDLAGTGWLVMTRERADPVAVLLIPVVFSAVLRLRLGQVWIGTIAAIVIVLARWGAESRGMIKQDVSGLTDPLLLVAILALSGILAGQIIRRTLALAGVVDQNVGGSI
jgi:hypothetical protein